MAVRLLPPGLDGVPAYAAALRAGWSANTTRDTSGEQLAAIAADAAGFIATLARQDGTVTLGDGQVVPRLPGRVFWVWDGAFAGSINVRFVPGTLELPAHVSGHVGYAVVPWMRRRGVATQALALLRPLAHGLGLPQVSLTCDADNLASRRVIERNGGVPAEQGERLGLPKLLFWMGTGPG